MILLSYSAPSRLNNIKLTADTAMLGEAHPVAGLICLFGNFLRIVMSDPVLGKIGMSYTSAMESGNMLAKIHPGAYFIYISFAVLLFSHGTPMRQAMRTFKEYKIYSSFLLLYAFLFFYWAVRSPIGVGMIIDTHMTVPITAIVMCYTPRSYCRTAIKFFLGIAVLNSTIGIVEAIGKFRIFTFDPNWPVLAEANFRASALLGHPLNNATFTCIALLVAMAMDYSRPTKILMACIFLASLVGFGGRAALVLSVVGLIPIAFDSIRQQQKQMTLIKLFFIIAAVIIVPILLAGGLYILVNSSMGDRLMAFSSFKDSSAETRVEVFRVFDYMKPEEILFGISADRVEEVAHRIGLSLAFDDIENPWVLMLMLLGAIMFSLWLPMTLLFAVRLMWDKPFSLRVAVIAYYITASTANSFGRKDGVYSVMVAVVTAAARALELRAMQNAALPPQGVHPSTAKAMQIASRS